ncbi:MAG: aldo/keto reductase, partial [Selenomonadaceae bacterium]|nr:aldo/keto reductase [Selenomonadaceae bacterium]
AHNPASKALLDACDRLGMLVMDEFCDNWLIHKNPHDYADADFRACWESDLRAMLIKNYNHPSVVMTSIGNEISELALPEGQEYCKTMADYCRAFDPFRPVTLGVNFMLCSMTAKGGGIYGEKKNGKENKNGSQGMDNLPTSQFFNFWMHKLGGLIEGMAAKPAADKATETAIAALDIGYVDLMLIHQPGYGDDEAYRALERAVQAGKVRSIGISNYYTPEDFDRIRNAAQIVPAVVQNENHPYFQNAQLQAYVAQFGTVVESWYPFGGRGNTQKIFGDATIQQLAKKYSKSPAQIVLRWQLQAGYVAIPGSSNPKHIAENFDIFDFSLTPDEMNQMRGLNRNQRFEQW